MSLDGFFTALKQADPQPLLDYLAAEGFKTLTNGQGIGRHPKLVRKKSALEVVADLKQYGIGTFTYMDGNIMVVALEPADIPKAVLTAYPDAFTHAPAAEPLPAE